MISRGSQIRLISLTKMLTRRAGDPAPAVVAALDL